MNDFKFKGKCSTCKMSKFFIRKAKVMLPIGIEAVSQELMCGDCIKKIRDNVK